MPTESAGDFATFSHANRVVSFPLRQAVAAQQAREQLHWLDPQRAQGIQKIAAD